MQKRALGSTGEMLSIIGFGGIVVTDVTTEEAASAVAEAVDRGINYFDVAPSYGNAEKRLGPALEPYRDQVFLACKTGKRDKASAAEELRQSLSRLKTDHFDLYQLHAMTSEEDFEKAMGPGGALEAFVEAREQGLVRYLGFSAHSAETACRLMDAFDFDSVLFPVNYVLYSQAGFGPQVVAKAEEKGVGRLCLKAMARTNWTEGAERHHSKCWYEPITDPEEAALALRFTLSRPVTAAVPPGHRDLFRLACDVAERFTPITQEETEELFRRAQGLNPIFRLAA
ncbi:MAG: aldo/keto reductase [Armatimonadetes bacterium]|nr:aldo/keto reductase [Armatimonadota bacterium]